MQRTTLSRCHVLRKSAAARGSSWSMLHVLTQLVGITSFLSVRFGTRGGRPTQPLPESVYGTLRSLGRHDQHGAAQPDRSALPTPFAGALVLRGNRSASQLFVYANAMPTGVFLRLGVYWTGLTRKSTRIRPSSETLLDDRAGGPCAWKHKHVRFRTP